MSTHNMFLLRNKKDISSFQMKKVPYLLLCPCFANRANQAAKPAKHHSPSLFQLSTELKTSNFDFRGQTAKNEYLT